MSDENQVSVSSQVDYLTKFLSFITTAKFTVVFMFTVAQLTFFTVVKEDARHSCSVVINLYFIKLVPDIFSIVFQSVFLEEMFVFGVEHRLLTVVRIVSVELP